MQLGKVAVAARQFLAVFRQFHGVVGQPREQVERLLVFPGRGGEVAAFVQDERQVVSVMRQVQAVLGGRGSAGRQRDQQSDGLLEMRNGGGAVAAMIEEVCPQTVEN